MMKVMFVSMDRLVYYCLQLVQQESGTSVGLSSKTLLNSSLSSYLKPPNVGHHYIDDKLCSA